MIRSGRFPVLKRKVLYMLKKFKGVVVGIPAAAALVAVSAPAHAAIDLSAITGAITATEIVVGVLAIAGILATVYGTIKAAKIALSMLKSA